MELPRNIGDLLTLNDQFETQQNQIVGDLLDLNKEQESVTLQEGNSKARLATIQGQQQVLNMQQERETEKVISQQAAAFGTDPRQASDISLAMAENLRLKTAAVAGLSSKISGIMGSANLLTNPLGWLKGLVVGEPLARKRDALQEEIDVDARNLQNLNSLTQTAAVTAKAVQTTVGVADIKNATDAASLLADQARLSAKLDSMKHQTSSLELLRSTNASDFNKNMGLFNAVQENDHWQAGYQLRKLQIEEYTTNSAARLDEAESLKQTLQDVNTARATLNQPLIGAFELKKLYGQPGIEGEKIRNQQAMGFRMRNTGNQSVYGTTPVEAMQTTSIQGIEPPLSFAPSTRIMQEAQEKFNLAQLEASDKDGRKNTPADLKRRQGLTAANIKDEASLTKAFNGFAKEIADLYLADQSTVGNPYGLPALDAMMAEDKKVMTTDFGQKVVGVLKAANVQTVDPARLVSQTASAILTDPGKYNAYVNAGAQFVSNGVALQSATAGYRAFGLPSPTGYNVSLSNLTSSQGSGKFLKSAAKFQLRIPVIAGGGAVLAGYNALGEAENAKTSEAAGVKDFTQIKSFDLTKPQDYSIAVAIEISKRQAAQMRSVANTQGLTGFENKVP